MSGIYSSFSFLICLFLSGYNCVLIFMGGRIGFNIFLQHMSVSKVKLWNDQLKNIWYGFPKNRDFFLTKFMFLINKTRINSRGPISNTTIKLGWKLNFYHVAKRESKPRESKAKWESWTERNKAELSIKLSMTQSCHMRGWNKRIQSSRKVYTTWDPVSN